MPTKREIRKARAEAGDSPTAWFCVLEQARTTGDYALAARAEHELRRLGVRVRFGRPASDGSGVGHA